MPGKVKRKEHEACNCDRCMAFGHIGRRAKKPRTSEPPQPMAPPAVCRGERGSCKKPLRVNNLSGLCQRCRQKLPSRTRAALIPRVARAAGNAGQALASSQQEAVPGTFGDNSSLCADAVPGGIGQK